jgi:N-sulfoglucosamine sulfohydrolase
MHPTPPRRLPARSRAALTPAPAPRAPAGARARAREPQRALRTTRHKYIRRWGERRTPVLANTDDGPSKDLLLAGRWAEREIPKEQLYDLLFDPNEADNLLDDPGYADVLADLRGRLQTWMSDTDDPLLAGHVDPPPGVEINLPDQLSASEPTTRIG